MNLTLLRKMHLQTFKNIFLQQMETIYLTLTAVWPDETAPSNSKKPFSKYPSKNMFLQQMEYLTLIAVWADEIAPSNFKEYYQKPLF